MLRLLHIQIRLYKKIDVSIYNVRNISEVRRGTLSKIWTHNTLLLLHYLAVLIVTFVATRSVTAYFVGVHDS